MPATLRNFRIQVTWGDIESGVCGDAQRCAIARAVLRATGARSVRVMDDHIVTAEPYLYAQTPPVAAHFIDAFDSERSRANPISFDLAMEPITREQYRGMVFDAA